MKNVVNHSTLAPSSSKTNHLIECPENEALQNSDSKNRLEKSFLDISNNTPSKLVNSSTQSSFHQENEVVNHSTPISNTNNSENICNQKDILLDISNLSSSTSNLTTKPTDEEISSLSVNSTEISGEILSTRSRKRKKNDETWKRNVRKKLKNKGETYFSTKNKVIAAKNTPRPCDCSKCKKKCTEKFNEDERKMINSIYWKTGSYERQREFICKHVTIKHVTPKNDAETTETRKRNRLLTYSYFLPQIDTSNQNSIQVCKSFFLATLNIGQKTILVAKEKEMCSMSIVIEDKRGKKPPPNKTPDCNVKIVMEHINSFPRVESHYCRASSKREYLDPSLSMRKMYDLYNIFCKEKEVAPVKLHMYRKIFLTKFNLSFHCPKKDTCKTCEKFSNLEGDEKESFREIYDKHISNKDQAREMKSYDKAQAQADKSMKVYTFDLQSVLNTPRSNVSNFYYSRKFSTYNLTIYDLSNKDGFCYTWNECDGMKGSDEVGTALWLHLCSLPKDVEKVIFYSDCCGGQNRNRFIAGLMAYAIKNLHFKSIEMKFLESGHTQMEADSMHSSIEQAISKLSVYSPIEFLTIFKMARRKNPYTVTKMNFDDILDLKKLKENTIDGNMDVDVLGEKICWTEIKWLKFLKSNPQSMLLKKHYTDSNFTALVLKEKKFKFKNIPQKYSKPVPISVLKKKDLLSLCYQNLIPSQYHEFFEKLVADDKLDDEKEQQKPETPKRSRRVEKNARISIAESKRIKMSERIKKNKKIVKTK